MFRLNNSNSYYVYWTFIIHGLSAFLIDYLLIGTFSYSESSFSYSVFNQNIYLQSFSIISFILSFFLLVIIFSLLVSFFGNFASTEAAGKSSSLRSDFLLRSKQVFLNFFYFCTRVSKQSIKFCYRKLQGFFWKDKYSHMFGKWYLVKNIKRDEKNKKLYKNKIVDTIVLFPTLWKTFFLFLWWVLLKVSVFLIFCFTLFFIFYVYYSKKMCNVYIEKSRKDLVLESCMDVRKHVLITRNVNIIWSLINNLLFFGFIFDSSSSHGQSFFKYMFLLWNSFFWTKGIIVLIEYWSGLYHASYKLTHLLYSNSFQFSFVFIFVFLLSISRGEIKFHCFGSNQYYLLSFFICWGRLSFKFFYDLISYLLEAIELSFINNSLLGLTQRLLLWFILFFVVLTFVSVFLLLIYNQFFNKNLLSNYEVQIVLK